MKRGVVCLSVFVILILTLSLSSAGWFDFFDRITGRVTSVPVGTGTGLNGSYYDNKDFTNLKLNRIDPTVNFDWRTNPPHSSMENDTFSIRWNGFVEPRYTERYTFYGLSNNGMRVWVNNTLLVDDWISHSSQEASGSIDLEAGQKYPIIIEYYEDDNNAVVKLYWSSTNQIKQIVPQAQLYPPSIASTPEDCRDSDGGKNYDIKGNVCNSQSCRGDYCSNATVVSEYYCEGNSRTIIKANCPYGCENGACKSGVGPVPGNGSLRVHVHDDFAKKFLGNAVVYVYKFDGTLVDQRSSAVKNYSHFDDLPQDEYTVVATAPGFYNATKKIIVVANDLTHLFMNITRLPEGPCFDSDGGKIYDVKGTISPLNAPWGINTDSCANKVGTDVSRVTSCTGGNCILAELYCSSGGASSVEYYNCPSGCNDGVCFESACGDDICSIGEDVNTCPDDCDDSYTIYYENTKTYGKNIIEIGNRVNLSYSIEVKEDDVQKVPSVILVPITLPNSSISKVFFSRTGVGAEYCYEYRVGADVTEARCTIRLDGAINVNQEGKYKDRYNKTVILGVSPGYYASKLILDSKFKPSNVSGYYRDYEDRISLSVGYDDEAALGYYEFRDEVSAKIMIDEILEDITSGQEVGNVLYGASTVHGELVYMMEYSENNRPFVVLFWRDSNKVLTFFGSSSDSLDVNLSISEVIDSLRGKRLTFVGNPSEEDLNELASELAGLYLEKYPSSLEGGEIKCVPNWQCSIIPTICPQHGVQTKVCTDLNKCTQDIRSELQCTPGICSGCYYPKWVGLRNDICMPYGTRFDYTKSDWTADVIKEGDVDKFTSLKVLSSDSAEFTMYGDTSVSKYQLKAGESVRIQLPMWDPSIREVILNLNEVTYISEGNANNSASLSILWTKNFNAYCDIDGVVKPQVAEINGTAASCQNNYECESNFCSSGKCIEIREAIEKSKGIMSLFVRVLCRLGNIFNETKYGQCIAENLRF